jgi:phosphoethanolamine N-methyltransferase
MTDTNKHTHRNSLQEVQCFRWFQGKQLVALARGGDYAHPGEEEIIDLAFAPLGRDPQRTVLDVACGLGGTAHYIQQRGWGRVTGVDIEELSINYAKETYPTVEFHVADATKIDQVLPGRTFDVISLFSAILVLPDQLGTLKTARKMAHETSTLIIFDCPDLTEDGRNLLNRVGGDKSCFKLIRCDDFPKMLRQAGWRQTKFVDLRVECERWYHGLVANFEQKRQQIVARFGEEMYQAGYNRYNGFYNAMREGTMGCGIFYAVAD